MEKVILYIKSKEDPSSYYRLYQYFYNVSKKKIKIAESIPAWLYRWYYDKSHRGYLEVFLLATISIVRTFFFFLYDCLIFHAKIVVVNRRFFARRCPKILGLILARYLKRKRVIWDFDDNIILDQEITKREKQILQQMAEKIVVTGEYLRSTLKKEVWKKVILLPTTDLRLERENISDWIKRREQLYDHKIRLIWIGSRANLPELETILPIIEKAAEKISIETNKQIFLYCVCNEKITQTFSNIRIINILWSREKAVKYMKQSHIGLMPLKDTPYTRGKAGFKGVQYLSAGIPTIASDVGFNHKVVINGTDGFLVSGNEALKEAIIRLSTEKILWKQMACQGRKDWEKKFLASRYRNFWINLMCNTNV